MMTVEDLRKLTYDVDNNKEVQVVLATTNFGGEYLKVTKAFIEKSTDGDEVILLVEEEQK